MGTGRVYLIRHAAAEGDDGADPSLSAVGRAQAGALAVRLASSGAVSVLHSPLRRAAETAAVVADVLPGVRAAASSQLDDRILVPTPATTSSRGRTDRD